MKTTKHIFIFLCLHLIIVRSYGQVQWEYHNTGTENNLNRVFFPSENTGFILPANGPLLKTTDGGDSWDSTGSLQLNSSSLYHNELFFISNSIGWVSTRDSNGSLSLLKTVDGGNNWTDVSPDTNIIGRLTVQFINESVGYAYINAHFDDRLWKSNNGGETWSEIVLGFSLGSGTGVIPTMELLNDSTLYLIGGDNSFNYKGKIAKTTSSGSAWTFTELEGDQRLLHHIDFPNPDTGYVITNNGFISRTVDAGITWNYLYDFNISNPRIHFVNGIEGYVVAGSTIYKTKDGGATWGTEMLIFGNFSDVFYTNSTVAFAVADYGQVYRRKVTIGLSENPSDSKLSISPNPSSGVFNIHFKESTSGLLELRNIAGEKVYDEFVSSKTSHTLMLNHLPKGVYFIRLHNASSNFYAKLILN